VDVSTSTSWRNDPYGTANATSGSPSISGVTSAYGELALAVTGVDLDPGLTNGANQTEVAIVEFNTNGVITCGAATKPGADTGVGFSWSDVNDQYGVIAVSLKPAAGTGASWAADEDTKLTQLSKSTTKHLRFLVDNSGSVSSGAVSYELQVAEQDTDDCASGSYTAVDSSTHWNITDSNYLVDGAASLGGR
jgi:hypothetical protein